MKRSKLIRELQEAIDHLLPIDYGYGDQDYEEGYEAAKDDVKDVLEKFKKKIRVQDEAEEVPSQGDEVPAPEQGRGPVHADEKRKDKGSD